MKLPRSMPAPEVSATHATWSLAFCDPRSPHEVCFGLERELMTLFTSSLEGEILVARAAPTINGIQYTFVLRFEAAGASCHHYVLHMKGDWAAQPATHHEYFGKTVVSWFELWTRGLQPAPVPSHRGDRTRYDELVRAGMVAEAQLSTVPAIQAAIVDALRRGASFRTAHKEGGTTLRWENQRYIRSDYGESSDQQVYPSEAEFLKALRQFYDWETSRNVYPAKVPDLDAWKLIFRLLWWD